MYINAVMPDLCDVQYGRETMHPCLGVPVAATRCEIVDGSVR